MIRIQLSQRDQSSLEQAFRNATERKFHDRLQIIRLAHRNRPHQEIAADLGITPRTVQRWLNAYHPAATAVSASRAIFWVGAADATGRVTARACGS